MAVDVLKSTSRPSWHIILTMVALPLLSGSVRGTIWGVELDKPGNGTDKAEQQVRMGRRVPRPTLVRLPGLLHWRIQRGYSQPQLAALATTTRVTIGRLENGGETRLSTASRLAAALQVDLAQLMEERPKPGRTA